MFRIHTLSHSTPRLSIIKRTLRTLGLRHLQSSAASDLSNFAQRKSGKRGGQDLTHRDVRLAKSIRQKQAFARVGLPETNALDPSSTTNEGIARGETSVASTKPSATMFRGTVLPQKPRPPEADECCMSGCAVCVYDLYLTSLESYREEVSTVRSTLRARSIPHTDWPKEVQENTDDNDSATSSDLDPNMSAFAALEKSLREASKPSKC